jgi:hypothetical protein
MIHQSSISDQVYQLAHHRVLFIRPKFRQCGDAIRTAVHYVHHKLYDGLFVCLLWYVYSYKHISFTYISNLFSNSISVENRSYPVSKETSASLDHVCVDVNICMC